MNVAQTILEQLGGNRFIVMTGAKQFLGLDNGLRFRIPRTASGATLVRVTLDPSDTYSIQFGRIGKVGGLSTFVEIAAESFVYADQLRDVFTARTGYDTHL